MRFRSTIIAGVGAVAYGFTREDILFILTCIITLLSMIYDYYKNKKD